MSDPLFMVVGSRHGDVAWEYDDGGRADAGFRGKTGDCVTRSIAIALELPYREVYFELLRRIRGPGVTLTPEQGVARKVYDVYLAERGWRWTPTMTIGSGCQTHLRANELPTGRLIARLSRHLVAVVDGVVRDTADPSRDGTRCVYGYFAPEEAS